MKRRMNRARGFKNVKKHIKNCINMKEIAPGCWTKPPGRFII